MSVQYNKVWSTGRLTPSWKHGVIVPIIKPAKDKYNAVNYRPITLTSSLCKIMERMIVYKLNYMLERKGSISPQESGFHKGQSTADAALCLEIDIRKTQVNKNGSRCVF